MSQSGECAKTSDALRDAANEMLARNVRTAQIVENSALYFQAAAGFAQAAAQFAIADALAALSKDDEP